MSSKFHILFIFRIFYTLLCHLSMKQHYSYFSRLTLYPICWKISRNTAPLFCSLQDILHTTRAPFFESTLLTVVGLTCLFCRKNIINQEKNYKGFCQKMAWIWQRDHLMPFPLHKNDDMYPSHTHTYQPILQQQPKEILIFMLRFSQKFQILNVVFW